MTSLYNPPTPLAKIDWYSFTLPTAGPLEGSGPDVMAAVNYSLQQAFTPIVDPVSMDGTWRIDPAKGFYAFRATHVTSKLAVSWGAVNSHVFVEMAGMCCDWFRASRSLQSVIELTYQRVSRIDCAIDLVTPVLPETFVEAGHAKRFADSLGNIKSLTGHTFYVGSRKSDRCARVYRYASPHPRSHLLRIEAEFKGKAARELAKVLYNRGELEAIRSAHAVFEWQSSELRMDFLARVNSSLDRQINPVMGSNGGLPPAYTPPLSDISLTDWLTLSDGWKKWYYQHLKRRR